MKMLFDDAPVIMAAGMAFEARIAKGAGVRAVYGQKREVYMQKLHDFARAAPGASSVSAWPAVFRRC